MENLIKKMTNNCNDNSGIEIQQISKYENMLEIISFFYNGGMVEKDMLYVLYFSMES